MPPKQGGSPRSRACLRNQNPVSATSIVFNPPILMMRRGKDRLERCVERPANKFQASERLSGAGTDLRDIEESLAGKGQNAESPVGYGGSLWFEGDSDITWVPKNLVALGGGRDAIVFTAGLGENSANHAISHLCQPRTGRIKARSHYEIKTGQGRSKPSMRTGQPRGTLTMPDQ